MQALDGSFSLQYVRVSLSRPNRTPEPLLWDLGWLFVVGGSPLWVVERETSRIILRPADSGQSPRAAQQTLPAAPPEPLQSKSLLFLLASPHPFVSSAINGSVSGYATSTSYSARFKSSAKFLERNIGSRVANMVGTVGRRNGVESGWRWAPAKATIAHC